MSITTCLKREAQLPISAVKRLNVLDRGINKRKLRSCNTKNKMLRGEEELVLLERYGAGAVCTLFLELQGSTAKACSDSRISIYVDGESKPSITGTVENLFLSGREGKKTYGDYAGKTVYDLEEKRISHYRYLFIPYSEGCRVVLTAPKGEVLEHINSDIYYHVDRDGGDIDFGRYGKAYSVEKKGIESRHNEKVVLASIKGKGALQSFQFSMSNPDTAGTFMEGNIEFYIDGNKFAEYQSTGTEEFFMGGVYFISLHQSAYSGCTRSFNDGSINPEHISSAHRLFVDDPVTFEKELKIIWHNGETDQGVPYAGVTNYDFHAIYYTETEETKDITRLSLEEAEGRITSIDGRFNDLPVKSKTINRLELSPGENILFDIKESGCISSIFLELDNAKTYEGTVIQLEIDGHKTDEVPLKLFFLSATCGKNHVGQYAGSTSSGTFYRLIDIPFDSQFKATIKSPEMVYINGRIEYKSGENAGRGWFGMSGTSVELKEGESIELVNTSGEGKLEDIVLEVLGESISSGKIAVFTDKLNYADIETDDTSTFFLSGFGFSGGEGVSADVGTIQSNNNSVTAFRRFSEDSLAFKKELKIVYTAQKPVKLSGIVTYRMKKEHEIINTTLKNIIRRLNILDKDKDNYYGCCYSSMEDHQVITEPGDTHILFEDFGPGMIDCIRLGTPNAGRAMLAARFKIYLNGEETPSVDTTVGRFFSANYEDAIFWSGSRYLSRPSKCLCKSSILAYFCSLKLYCAILVDTCPNHRAPLVFFYRNAFPCKH
jgi:hypothetical protein